MEVRQTTTDTSHKIKPTLKHIYDKRWTSCTPHSPLFSTVSRLYKRTQSIGGLTSSLSPGEYVSSSLTSCTSTPQSHLSLTSSRLCSLRQYPLFSKPAPPAVLAEHFTSEVFEKSQKYGKHKAKFSLVSGLYKQVIDTLQLASGVYYPWAWSAAGQLLGLAGYGSEYLVCPRPLIFLGLNFSLYLRRFLSRFYSSFF